MGLKPGRMKGPVGGGTPGGNEGGWDVHGSWESWRWHIECSHWLDRRNLKKKKVGQMNK